MLQWPTEGPGQERWSPTPSGEMEAMEEESGRVGEGVSLEFRVRNVELRCPWGGQTVAAGSFKLELRKQYGQEIGNLEVSGHLGERPVENKLRSRAFGARQRGRGGGERDHRRQQRRDSSAPCPREPTCPAAWWLWEATKQGPGLHHSGRLSKWEGGQRAELSMKGNGKGAAAGRECRVKELEV